MAPHVGAQPSRRYSPKMACSTIPKRASTVAATRLIALRGRSGLLTLTLSISALPSPRNPAMAGGSNGYRAAPVRRQLTISSLPETAGLPPFISFSTSYPEQHSDLSQIKTFGGGSADRTEIERCVLRHSIVFPHCQFFS